MESRAQKHQAARQERCDHGLFRDEGAQGIGRRERRLRRLSVSWVPVGFLALTHDRLPNTFRPAALTTITAPPGLTLLSSIQPR
jgi:hypothetical protein